MVCISRFAKAILSSETELVLGTIRVKMVWTSEKNGKEKTTTKNVKFKVQGKLPCGRWINQVKKNLQESGYDWEELKRRKAWEDGEQWRHNWNRSTKRT